MSPASPSPAAGQAPSPPSASFLVRELEYFFAALRFFTRLRVPAWVGHSEEQLNHAARYFPLVGTLVGAIGASLTLALALVLPSPLAILLGMGATVLATGAFHEDGFADACDGFGGGWEKAQVLRIMKDSRVGSFGAIGISLLLFAKFTALAELHARFGAPTLGLALVAAHAASRFASTTLIHTLDYVRDDDSSKSKPLASRLSRGELVAAAAFGLLPCLLLPWLRAGVGLCAAAGVTLLAALYFVRRIGGYTGDCLGATQQASEVAFYLGLLFLCSST